MWSRIHLIPMLQAEEDRDQVRRHFADKAREKELLGAETKVYHSDRYFLLFILRNHTAHETNDMIQFRSPDICCHS
jgi:hypothetical protein